ncbi:hypothetical protein B0T09DRAFT_338002 [Sordaria sp. MPI-SDFR-AT-0083]|nr:hypothetical protein B0T09DRAFT_338002 [Sordaria sp. MPI-SDFR-AT-0083]
MPCFHGASLCLALLTLPSVRLVRALGMDAGRLCLQLSIPLDMEVTEWHVNCRKQVQYSSVLSATYPPGYLLSRCWIVPCSG